MCTNTRKVCCCFFLNVLCHEETALGFFPTVENQTQLATITEKERSANEKVMDLSTQVATLESQNSRLRQDKAQLTGQLEMLKTKIQVLEDAKHR